MISSVAMDASVTWAGAAGSAFYLGHLYRQGHRGIGAQSFLVLVLTALLLVRGFAWLTGYSGLDRLTFAIATWLPLAISLFIERVLRRHHPLWVKLFVLAPSALFFAGSVLLPRVSYERWLLPFAAFLTLAVLLNGALLLSRPKAELGAGENRLAGLLFLLAFLTAALAITDFRTNIEVGRVRLGAIAALLFVYSMLGATLRSASAFVWAWRFFRLLVLAAILSGLVALATDHATIRSWVDASLGTLPITYAWMLLTGIVVNSRELTQETYTDDFMQWLKRVRLKNSELYRADLASAPDAATHAMLAEKDLTDYSKASLARFAGACNGIVALTGARRTARQTQSDLAESAEQWLDLLERTQMTHGFIARHEPLTVFLMNLPSTSSTAAAETRLSVMQHISHEIEEGERR